jgi:transcriptional regulator with XRE-family HTH domain
MSTKRKTRFSDQLRQAVDKSGLSRYEICKRAGLDQSVMHRFMHGTSGLRMVTIDAICEILGLELKTRQLARKPKSRTNKG